VLLVIYFLVHVKNPPVLPNLQQMPPMRPISHVCPTLRFYRVLLVDAHSQDDTHIRGYNTWYALHRCAMPLETDKLIVPQVL
jgi:terminal uridylyltransferase